MNQINLDDLQLKVLNLVPNGQGFLLEDSCSEVVRLVAGWLKKANSQDELLILKGENVLKSQKSHDLLAIKSNKEVCIVDPTVWQFFPERESILVFKGVSIEEGLDKVREIYGGNWEIVEEIASVTPEEEETYLDIIEKNIKENLR